MKGAVFLSALVTGRGKRCMSGDFAGGKMPCEGVVSGYFLGGIIEGEKKKSIIKNRMFLRSMWGDDILIFNRE